MTVPEHPTMALHNLLAKRGFSTDMEWVITKVREGRDNSLCWKAEYTFLDTTYVGFGQKKQDAKDQAALKVLHSLNPDVPI
ncbi:hypothetical protein BOTBODRAFT_187864 [Botryobasidium botryosum FD-172 SS1]|uniref:DRBM domain-containing protein n=1 Tax=Botryobasidium botryosum (strain FD-172 SS1) TaxID=930990 RepID=A0A067MFF7_BOTB1|nr:hypothetical protein BOTBODRAFT_187864 [Botryobasidium botryosum FD-172 SS1]